MKKHKLNSDEYYKLLKEKSITRDGGYILDDSLPNPVFANAEDSPEERARIMKINQDAFNKYFRIE